MSVATIHHVAKDSPVQNITIERYGEHEAKDLATGKGFSACIYGQDDADQGWIFWLDETARPCVYFPNREPSGAVLEPHVSLVPVAA
jgi:hypothetical protein